MMRNIVTGPSIVISTDVEYAMPKPRMMYATTGMAMSGSIAGREPRSPRRPPGPAEPVHYRRFVIAGTGAQ